MGSRRRLAAGVVALALVGIAACGSSDDSSSDSASGSDSSSGEVRGVTDDSIVVGGIAQLSLYEGITEGAAARFDRVNREGGINGRDIDFVGVEDDGGDNSRDLDIARELVERDDVFAVAPVATQAFLPQSSDYLAAEQVPFVGWGFMPGFCGNEWAFGFNGCLVGEGAIQGSYLQPMIEISGKPADELRFAFQSEDGDAGKTALRDFGEICTIEGCTVSYSESDIPLNSNITDYTPYVEAILASDPDIVYVNVSFANAVGLTSALKAAGFDGLMANFVTYVPGLLESQPDVAAALEGTYVNVQIPPAEADTASSQLMAEDLEASGNDAFISFGASVGYWSADVLVQMLEAVGDDLTPETFDEVINGDGFVYEPVEGGIGPVSFPEDHDSPRSCTALVQVVDGAYEVALPMTCYENYER